MIYTNNIVFVRTLRYIIYLRGWHMHMVSMDARTRHTCKHRTEDDTSRVRTQPRRVKLKTDTDCLYQNLLINRAVAVQPIVDCRCPSVYFRVQTRPIGIFTSNSKHWYSIWLWQKKKQSYIHLSLYRLCIWTRTLYMPLEKKKVVLPPVLFNEHARYMAPLDFAWVIRAHLKFKFAGYYYYFRLAVLLPVSY